MIDRRDFLKNCGGLAGASLLPLGWKASQSGGKSPSRPNILILFADDLGFSDVGCFGGEIGTPNIDALASGGVRFTQFYNTSRCCPSRASLLTGLYAHEAGIGLMVYNDFGEGYNGHLNDRCVTLGQALRAAGYRTLFSGKWHAGHTPESRPEVRGFDQVTTVYQHIDSYWKVLQNCEIYRDGKILIPAGDSPVNPYHPNEEFYTTDFFTDTALDYIDQAHNLPEKPFFLHLCFNAPHFPLEAPDAGIDKWRGRYSEGWDRLRQTKFEKMKQLKIIGDKQQLPRLRGYIRERRQNLARSAVTDFLPAWESLSSEDRKELDFRRAIYAAQVERLDWNIGRVIDRLRTRGLLDNTLVLFFSDNGCSGEDSTFGMNWGKFTSSNYAEWRKKSGWSISQGQVWAGASNTPLQRYKLFVHEGGIASPFIAHWPAGIQDKGLLNTSQPCHLIDIMPTLCELAGATYPRAYEGRTILPARGMSLAPYLRNLQRKPVERTLFWQHETCAAVRRGNWKLVTVDDRDRNSWELYDLSEDRSETENLITRNPEVARQLKDLWSKWATETHVLPFPEDRKKPAG